MRAGKPQNYDQTRISVAVFNVDTRTLTSEEYDWIIQYISLQLNKYIHAQTQTHTWVRVFICTVNREVKKKSRENFKNRPN